MASAVCTATAAAIFTGGDVGSTESADALRKHLCGVYGKTLKPQESCPGVSPAHKWKRLTAYRNDDSGVDMCLVVRDRRHRHIFHRCDFYDTVITVGPSDLNKGRQRTRAYNKNNNVTRGREKRYLYATTGRR